MSNEVEITLKTRAELQGARQLEEQLQRDIGKAKALGQEYTELDRKLKQVQSTIAASKPAGPSLGDMFGKVKEGLGNVIPGFAKLDSLMSSFAGGALGAVAGGFTVIAGAASAAKNAVHEFAQAEEQVAKLDTALAQNGQLTEDYRAQLQDLAQQLQETTAIADDEWLGVLTRLTQFGANRENIEEYTDAVKNLAGLMGGDVQQAAMVFSKAMQGNFEAFSRYGIVVDDAGTKTDKLRRVMEELAQRGGGQLEAAARGLNGQWKQLANATADLSKGLGRLISESGVIQSALGLVTDSFSQLADWIGGIIPKLDGLENAVRPTSAAMEDAAESSKRMAQGLKEIESEATDAAAALGDTIARLHQLKQAQDEMEDAQMALEIAQVDAANPEGGVAALKQKAGIRQKFAKSKFDRGQAAIQAEVQAREGFYGEAASDVTLAERAVADQKKDLAERRKLEQAQAVVRTREQAFAKAEQEYKKAQAAAASLGVPSAGSAAVSLGSPALGGILNIYEKAGGAPDVAQAAGVVQAEGFLLKKAREKLAQFGPQPQGAISAAQSEAELKRREEELKARQKALEQAAPEYRKAEELRRQAELNQKVYGIRSQADTTTSQAEINRKKQEEEKKAIEDQIKIHGKSAAVDSLGAALQGAFNDLNEGWADAFEGLANDMRTAKQEIAVLRDRGSIRS